MTAAIDRLGRPAQVTLWCIYHCNKLVENGLMTGGGYDLTTQGQQEIEDLIASGFQPTDEEIIAVMQNLTQPTEAVA